MRGLISAFGKQIVRVLSFFFKEIWATVRQPRLVFSVVLGPFLILAAIPIGNLFGFHADTGAIMAMYTRSAPIADWLAWLATDAAPALVIGLFIVALASAFVGWATTVVFWRWWIGRKWRRRVPAARAD